MRQRLETALQQHPALMENLRRLLTESPTFAKVMWTVRGRQLVVLDYPVTGKPRYGYGMPAHSGLTDLISENDTTYVAFLERALKYKDAFTAIPLRHRSVSSEPCWANGWLPALDMVANYTLLAERGPEHYLEIGSGESTKLARRAIIDNELSTRITSIDPNPRAEVDRLCDAVLRQRLEDADLSVFSDLRPGDFVFFDGSHRCSMNSDVTVFFLEVLPNLPRGVVVGLHDIELPWDYPPSWTRRYYNEQYMLATYLLARGGSLDIVFPARYTTVTPHLETILRPLWSDPRLNGVEPSGASFWFTR